MPYPASISLNRLKRVLRAMCADPGLAPYSFAHERVVETGPG